MLRKLSASFQRAFSQLEQRFPKLRPHASTPPAASLLRSPAAFLRCPSPKREQQLTRRSSRRRSRFHFAHGLTLPSSLVADDPLYRRGHRPRSPRGTTCLHSARKREPSLRRLASRATLQNQKRCRVGFFSESFSAISCARSSPKSSRCASSFVAPFRSTSLA
jgi:hypothetical protein